MEVIKELKNIEEEITNLYDELHRKRKSKIEWSRENSKEIKKLYPKKNKIYLINDIKEIGISIYHWQTVLEDGEQYYFKAERIAFYPDSYSGFGDGKYSFCPTVRGDILDSNFKKIIEGEAVPIVTLKSINERDVNTNQRTNIYVMIDKNTGYYKIGRSKNPQIREKTLQSEKPTIEMLFNCSAKIKDEKKLHDIFREKRVRGEWFDLNGSDLVIIKNYLEIQ